MLKLLNIVNLCWILYGLEDFILVKTLLLVMYIY